MSYNRSEERELARDLRKKGYSYSEILPYLSITSKGTLSGWLSDIKIDDASKNRIFIERAKKSGVIKSNKYRNLRESYQQEGRIKAQENDSDHKALCMLYWAEGCKMRNEFRFVNTDANMIIYVYSCVKKYFNLSYNDFSLRVNTHIDNGLSLDEIQQYWLDLLDLPKSCLRKSTIDTRIASGKKGRKNVHHYGVCCLSVLKSTHIVQHIYGAIQEYAGFTNESWLG